MRLPDFGIVAATLVRMGMVLLVAMAMLMPLIFIFMF